MIGLGGGQLEQLRQCPGADCRQASPEQAQEGRAGALPELRFDHAAAPATLARSEKSRTCSKSHGRLDPPWRSPDGPPCTGACWSDAARCGASISRRPPQRPGTRFAHTEKLPYAGSRLRGEETRDELADASVGQVAPQLALPSIHAILEPRAPTRLSGTPPYTLAVWPSVPAALPSPRLAMGSAAASRPAQPSYQPSSAAMALRTATSCCSSLRSSPVPG